MWNQLETDWVKFVDGGLSLNNKVCAEMILFCAHCDRR